VSSASGSCPWDTLRQSPLGFCEQTLCAWTKQPANTWSNVGFLVVGALLWKLAARDRRPHLRVIAVVCALTGVGSAAYHASGAYGGGVFDLGTMFFGTGLLTGLNMRRWLGWGYAAMYATIALVSTVLMALVLAVPGDERLLFALAGPCCLIELGLFVKRRRETRYVNYVWAWGVMGIASALWWLDLTKRICNPDNHVINGHAIWHLLSALTYYFLYRFYAQFVVFEAPRGASPRSLRRG
jgi:hypothetical protein